MIETTYRRTRTGGLIGWTRKAAMIIIANAANKEGILASPGKKYSAYSWLHLFPGSTLGVASL